MEIIRLFLIYYLVWNVTISFRKKDRYDLQKLWNCLPLKTKSDTLFGPTHRLTIIQIWKELHTQDSNRGMNQGQRLATCHECVKIYFHWSSRWINPTTYISTTKWESSKERYNFLISYCVVKTVFLQVEIKMCALETWKILKKKEKS